MNNKFIILKINFFKISKLNLIYYIKKEINFMNNKFLFLLI
jgi:hypothetical protein